MVSYAVLSSTEEPETWHWFYQCSYTGYEFCYMSKNRRAGSPAPVVGASFPQNSNDSISEGFYHKISFHTYVKVCVFSRHIISSKIKFLYSSASSDLTLSPSGVFKWKCLMRLHNEHETLCKHIKFPALFAVCLKILTNTEVCCQHDCCHIEHYP